MTVGQSEGSILSRINWAEVNAQVCREQSNREHFTPLISLYRWWARRPHSLMGAILDSALEQHGRSLRVADPFSGGGTVTIEAARRRIPVYAQDLYPWPTLGLATALTPVSQKILEEASEALLEALAPLNASYTRPDGRILNQILRVRQGACPTCDQRVFLFPEALITRCSRHAAETEGYYGCRRCGHVQRAALTPAPDACEACGQTYSSARHCPHCRMEYLQERIFMTTPPVWHPLLVQETITVNKQPRGLLRLPDTNDPVIGLGTQPSTLFSQQPIPLGVETLRLQYLGFQTWGDLYTNRQAVVIEEGLGFLPTITPDAPTQQHLALTLLGLAEMPAFLCRWDRTALKAFEAIANHHYAHTTVVVEVNFLATQGRGTLPRRLRALRRAVTWRAKSIPHASEPLRTSPLGPDLGPNDIRPVIISTGSSTRQSLPTGSVDLILTDPPYFSDVQYGELARLFHAWAGLYMPLPPYDESEEAVPNASRARSASDYEAMLTTILRESRRTLAPGGRLVLTFHNKKLAAWRSLCVALHCACWRIVAIAVARSENAADHSKREGKGMLSDLVLECQPLDEAPTQLQWRGAQDSVEAYTLLAMGQAMHRSIHAGAPDTLTALFKSALAEAQIQQDIIS